MSTAPDEIVGTEAPARGLGRWRRTPLSNEGGAILVALWGVTVVVGVVVGQALTRSPSEVAYLEEIPDRFAKVVLRDGSPDAGEGSRARREEGKVGNKDARMERALSNRIKLDKEIAQQAGILGILGSRGSGGGGLGGGQSEGLGVGAGAVSGELAAPGAVPRAWFPETFLWAPQVVTDAEGEALIELSMPDQLGDWRVLGLSASRDGSVSGAELLLHTAMDAFVEPAPVPFLRAGDRLHLPVRVGNLSGERLEGLLDVGSEGLTGGLATSVVLPPGGSLLRVVELEAPTPGLASLRSELAGRDAVITEVEVLPQGRRTLSTSRGMVGGAQELLLEVPPEATWARVQLSVVPGPAGVLRAELARAGRDPGAAALLADLALGAWGAELLGRSGSPTDAAQDRAFRALRLRAAGSLAGARPETVVGTALHLVGLRGLEDQGGADEAADRLRAAQLGDGSWPVPAGSSLQQLLATTAWTCAVLDEAGARVRAAAVFERTLPLLLDPDRPSVDPYTPALILGSGAVDGETAGLLQAELEADLARLEAGEALDPQLRRPDGAPVGPADLDAALARALPGGHHLQAALQAWSPATGFGDGFATVELLAIMGRSEAPTAGMVEVELVVGGVARVVELDSRGDVVVETVSLAPTAGQVPVAILTGAEGTGLAWQARVESWSPWVEAPTPAGLALELSHEDLVAGRVAQVELVVKGPGDAPLVAELELPAGVVVPAQDWEGATLVASTEGRLVLGLPGGRQARHVVRFQVRPTLAGRLWTGATRLSLEEAPQQAAVMAPVAWTVGSG